MVQQEVIRKILEAGVQAPSGSNSQPWRFKVGADTIAVFMIPEKDHPILNFRNRGTLLAAGALIENIVVAAAHYAVKANVSILPDKYDPKLVGTVSLKAGGAKEELFEAIWKRATNRKPYSTKAIVDTTKQDLMAVPAALGERGVTLKLTERPDEIKKLAEAASVNEAVLFGNKELHRLFFKEIVWTEREENERKEGLYLKTMELKPSQAFAIRYLLKYWPVMKFFDRLGAGRSIARGNAEGYARCGAYGAVLCGDKDEDFVRSGRVIERAWLLATAAGLSFHLQTGVNFFYQRIVGGGEVVFSQKETVLIRREYAAIADIFGAKDRFVPALFRIGYGGEPSARSSKKTPEAIFS